MLKGVRDGEARPLLAAIAFLFCVLTALMALRPARDALGMQHGVESVRSLIVTTAVLTLAFNPLFGWLVSRFRRLHVVGATYGFLASSLVAFWALMTFAPASIARASSSVFYVWFNVFNLFATMVAWAALSDRFTSDQSKRLFGRIAIGGTLGAVFGPWLTSRLATRIDATSMLLVAAGFLLLAWLNAAALLRSPHRQSGPEPERIGGSPWAGVRSVVTSTYLAGVAGYVALASAMVTLAYFTRLQMVAAIANDVNARAMVLGNVDMWTHVAVLVLQLAFAAGLIERFGVGTSLALLPIATALGFIGLALCGPFGALIVLEVATRAVQRGITQPAREALFSVVCREDKYKAKAFIDTFVYRAGDVVGAQTESLLGRSGIAAVGLVAAVIPLALVWVGVALWLGRAHARHATSVAPA